MKKNFTLIELLVVIGIIAILASMLMPALSKAKEKANQADCTNNMKQISTTLMMYSNDFKNMFTVGIDKNGKYNESKPEETLHNSQGLANLYYCDYIKSPKTLICRSTKHTAASAGNDAWKTIAENTDSKDGKGTSDKYNSYLYNGGLCTTEVTSEHGIARDKGYDDKGNHKQYGNVLFGDGHVEGITGTKNMKWNEKDDCFHMNKYDKADFEMIEDNDLWPTEGK